MALWFCQRFSNYVQTECLQQASKNVAILKELQKQLEELRLVADTIKEQARNLKVVFLGQPGAGTTTAVCSLFGMLSMRAQKFHPPILPTAAGQSSVCDVVLAHRGTAAIQLEPMSLAKLESLIGSIASKKTPSSVHYCLQNMCGMTEREYQLLLKKHPTDKSLFEAIHDRSRYANRGQTSHTSLYPSDAWYESISIRLTLFY